MAAILTFNKCLCLRADYCNGKTAFSLNVVKST